MGKEYFQAYHSYLEALEALSDAESGRLFKACLRYSSTGKAPELSGNERILFPSWKSQIDRDTERYERKCRINKTNGALGGKRTAANGSERPPNASQGEGEGEISSLLSQPAVCDDKKSKVKEFAPDSTPYLAAAYMAKKIKKHTPSFPHLRDGKEAETIQRWAADIDKLLRIDKVPFDEFKAVLEFSQNDPFWQKNILSGKKLREQYGAMLVRLTNEE